MQKYWFKRRRYGYGWAPVTWQGFVVVCIYLGLLIGVASIMDENMSFGEATSYLIFVVIATLLLIIVSSYYGPKPKWRWGKRPDDDPKKDF